VVASAHIANDLSLRGCSARAHLRADMGLRGGETVCAIAGRKARRHGRASPSHAAWSHGIHRSRSPATAWAAYSRSAARFPPSRPVHRQRTGAAHTDELAFFKQFSSIVTDNGCSGILLSLQHPWNLFRPFRYTHYLPAYSISFLLRSFWTRRFS
jgi:hypothetical protein